MVKFRACLHAFLWVCVGLCVVLAFSEFYLERRGYSLEWRQVLDMTILNKGDAATQQLWRRCGWSGDPGKHISPEDPTVREDVWPNGMRVCRESIDKPAPVNVAFFGCSYTFGQGVPAPKTMVYRLNTHYPQVCFDNYGVCGTSLIHALESMRIVLAGKKKYDLVVFDAIKGHLYRDPMLRAAGSLEKNRVYAVCGQVYTDIFGNCHVIYSDERRWPGEDFLLTVDFLKRVYYGIQVKRCAEMEARRDESLVHTADGLPPKTWLYLVGQMRELCREHDTDFVVCSLDTGLDAEWRETPGVEMVKLDMHESGEARFRVKGNPRFHPNAVIHQCWACKFEKWFNGYMEKKHPDMAMPNPEPFPYLGPFVTPQAAQSK